MNTEKYVLEKINNILRTPGMYGSCNESVEFQILTLLEVFILDSKRIILDLYIVESKKLFPKLGSLMPSTVITNRNEFNEFLNKVIPILIEKVVKNEME